MARVDWEENPLKLATKERHVIVVPTVRARLEDDEGNPVAGQPCLITGPNGFRSQARTDADGRVSVLAPKGDAYEISFTELDGELWEPSEKADESEEPE